jgi:redox-sensitive bicupin YhaK (pirin superfamily)
MEREIKKIVTGIQTSDGAGVRLTRVISHPDVYDFDPFLMLDAFDSKNPDDYTRGFPWHPHRGIETVTYLISGDIEHGDSLGNSGSIQDGCGQWMTAGSGIIHQEMPKPSQHMLGVQLWLNLPGQYKMAPPKYRDIRVDRMPHTSGLEYTVSVLSGRFEGVPGAIACDYVQATFLDAAIKPSATFSMKTDPEDTLFAYIIQGEGAFGSSPQEVPSKRAVLFGKGSLLKIKAGPGGLRLLLLSGQPLGEPIAWGGPIVMNTQEELDLAFRELNNGTFIKI